MIKKIALVTMAATSFIGIAANGQTFNQSITAIFGAGNPNDGWTVGSDNGITVALRAKNRQTGSTANADGVYTEPIGTVTPTSTRAAWNFEFSVAIDGDAVPLSTYDYYIGIDTNTSVQIGRLVLDALVFPDNAYGTSATANGAGTVGGETLAGQYSVSQNSENITFAFIGGNANANATYDYELYAVRKGDGPDGHRLASVSITVVIGSGGESVTDLINDIAAAVTASGASHGDYVNSVANLLNNLNATGVINKQERRDYMTAAAQSAIGK